MTLQHLRVQSLSHSLGDTAGRPECSLDLQDHATQQMNVATSPFKSCSNRSFSLIKDWMVYPSLRIRFEEEKRSKAFGSENGYS